MGTFSKLHRYRDAGDEANINNVERFGEPVHSLFTTSKVLSLHHHIDITDNNENILYQANSKAISIHDKTIVTDADENEICSIERKVMTIHGKHIVTMYNGKQFELSTELLHIVKNITDIKELGWKIQGNIMQLNFELYNANNEVIAVVSQKAISLHDKYCMDIYKPEYEPYCVAILITLQHMILDRQMAASAGSAH